MGTFLEGSVGFGLPRIKGRFFGLFKNHSKMLWSKAGACNRRPSVSGKSRLSFGCCVYVLMIMVEGLTGLTLAMSVEV